MVLIGTGAGQFTADVAGNAGAPLVILLHGFPQSRRSWRHQVPALGAAGYRAASIAEYLSVLGNAAALEAALAWYRAAGALANMQIGAITVPTLYLWGERDSSVGRAAAEWTAEHVTGPYRFSVVPAVGHFVTDEAPETVTKALLEHLASVAPGVRRPDPPAALSAPS